MQQRQSVCSFSFFILVKIDKSLLFALLLYCFDILQAASSRGMSEVASAAVIVYPDADLIDKVFVIEFRFLIIIVIAEYAFVRRGGIKPDLFIDHVGRKGFLVAEIDDVALRYATKGVVCITDLADILDMMYHGVVCSFLTSLLA